MDIYLVGGAVRDQLLGIDSSDRDYVVVGATTTDMLALGYQKVGKDFPVFIHPNTKEEYALARTERKKGSGYHGFTMVSSPTITLEEDLLRRDLTINAMAMDALGNLLDPYGGQNDINQRILRHVSLAFAEDPLRVIRLARFYTTLSHFHFSIASETLALVNKIITAKELELIAKERIWQEFLKVFKQSGNPYIFTKTLYEFKALEQISPIIAENIHYFNAQLSDSRLFETLNIEQRIALFFAQLPITAITSMQQALKVSNNDANRIYKLHLLLQFKIDHHPEKTLALLQQTDALREKSTFEMLLQCLDVYHQVNCSEELNPSNTLIQIANTLRDYDYRTLIQSHPKNQIADLVRNTKLQIIAEISA